MPAAYLVDGLALLTGRGALAVQTLLREGELTRQKFSPVEDEVLRVIEAAARIAMQRDDGSDCGTLGTDSELGSRMLSAQETAARLGCGDRNVTKRAESLGGWKVRGRWVFDEDEIEMVAMTTARRQGVA